MRRHIWPCYLPCIFMLTLKVTVIWTHSCYIHKKCAFLHKAENTNQTHQVRKHECADSQSSWEMATPFHSLAIVRRAAGYPEVQKCNICYCRDLSVDPKLLEAAPDEAGGFNEGSSTIQNLCTTPGSTDTLLWHMGAPPVSQRAVCKQQHRRQTLPWQGWEAKHGVSISGGRAREGHQRTWLCTTRFLGNSCQLMHGQGVLLRSMPGT